MRRWISARRSVFTGLRRQKLTCNRCYSVVVNDVERVSVRSGLSGTITIDLHNLSKVSSLEPLLVYLPPYSTAFSDEPVQLPAFMQRRPTAVINYRWEGFPAEEEEEEPPQSGEDDERSPHLSWPTPIHDAAKAYDWIVENLGPSTYTRRDVYLYGSYLGASLATSLALTETHPHARMGVRGCVAYNGVYDWTSVLPDHPVNSRRQASGGAPDFLADILSQPEEPAFRALRRRAEALFARPGNLFDPFASPCLFFHTPGLLVPPSFNESALPSPESESDDGEVDVLSLLLPPEEGPVPLKAPRRSALVFPPRKSTLKIPEALLLHSPAPSLLFHGGRRQRRRRRRPAKGQENSFSAHAEALAALMRRSIDKVELKERARWDDDFDGWDGEAERRVCARCVGRSPDDLWELDGEADEMAAAWLEDRIAQAR
ncbi:hypothetical protein GGR52DRAFT_503002 [Hypoxylon sp. FL1284]|nr:hypothetical protein GGR52DRAFT_503002 [Hypoxylon sp. FL1284]